MPPLSASECEDLHAVVGGVDDEELRPGDGQPTRVLERTGPLPLLPMWACAASMPSAVGDQQQVSEDRHADRTGEGPAASVHAALVGAIAAQEHVHAQV